MLATRLILVEGLSGMGKTTLTRHLGERIPNSRPWFELDEDHPIALGHGNDPAKSTPRATHSPRSLSASIPATETITMPFIGRPVKSISRACGCPSESS
jgi:hypothetical protein